jgi:hypothetical protein
VGVMNSSVFTSLNLIKSLAKKSSVNGSNSWKYNEYKIV